MSYTTLDLHFDAMHGGGSPCMKCIAWETEQALAEARRRWIAALQGWTCMGCGAEVDEWGRSRYGTQDCHACAAVFALISPEPPPQPQRDDDERE